MSKRNLFLHSLAIAVLSVAAMSGCAASKQQCTWSPAPPPAGTDTAYILIFPTADPGVKEISDVILSKIYLTLRAALVRSGHVVEIGPLTLEQAVAKAAQYPKAVCIGTNVTKVIHGSATARKMGFGVGVGSITLGLTFSAYDSRGSLIGTSNLEKFHNRNTSLTSLENNIIPTVGSAFTNSLGLPSVVNR